MQTHEVSRNLLETSCNCRRLQTRLF